MGVTNVPNEFTEDGDIPVGDNNFPGLTLSGYKYEGKIQDIMILPSMG